MRNTKRVFGERPQADWQRQPALQVQMVTRGSFIAGGPTEHFSKRMPTWQPSHADEGDLLPIDILYGSYCAAHRRIEIYIDRIRQDAKVFGADPNELIYLNPFARIRPRSCAISDECADAQLSAIPDGDSTDWSTWLANRNERFKGISEAVHELLAQTITYDAIGFLPADVSARLRNVFAALEERQPEIYKVPREVKDSSGRIDWPLVLDAAREEIGAPQTDGFDPVSGLKWLLCRSSDLIAKFVRDER